MLKKNYRRLSLLAILIVSALLLAGYGPTSVNAQSTSTQAGLAPKAEPSQDVQAKQAISDSVLTVNGMQFPKVAQPSNADAKMAGATAQRHYCCTPGETRTIEVGEIELWTKPLTRGTIFNPPGGPQELIYSPTLDCWVISSYSRVVTESNPPFKAWDDAQPANFVYVASTEYESVQNQMKNYVLNLNIASKYKADLNVKLEEFVKSYSRYVSSIRTSHGQVRHYAQVQGRGLLNGASHYKGHIISNEICCPPEVRDAAELKMTLKAWVDQTAGKLPKEGLDRRIDTQNIKMAPRIDPRLNPNLQVVPQ
jgi:hypothetical protein